MNALELLKQDHRKVEGLLSDLDSTSEDDAKRRDELFSTLREELGVHEILEEEILYPALEEMGAKMEERKKTAGGEARS